MSQEQVKRGEKKRAPWAIWLALAAAFAIFALTTWVIYYRFMTTPETNCIIAVSGNTSLDGYVVNVERITPDPGLKRSYRDTINQRNGYQARFFLTSGTYRVEVLDGSSERLHRETEFVPPGTRLLIDLNKRFPHKPASADTAGVR